MSNPINLSYGFDITPLWICPACGTVEKAGETWTPHPICNCRFGEGYVTQKQLNGPAQRLIESIEQWHLERHKESEVHPHA